MKYIKIYFLFMWTMCFVIAVYSSDFKINLPTVIAFSIPYLIVLWKRKKKKPAAVLSDNKQIDNRLKPEPTEPQYIETSNVIYRTDGNKITDAEIPYLMQLRNEKALSEEKQSRPVRTAHEQQLAFNFDMNHFDKFNNYEIKLMDLQTDALQEKNLTKKIQLLEETIKTYEKAKKFCYSKGKGGTIYFQDEWESSPFLSNILNELKETKIKLDIVIPGIISTISNNDGILQRNIYSYFPDIKQSEIQAIIKELEANGTITRTKKSNSYELHINSN